MGRWCLDLLGETAMGAGFELLAYCLMPDHLHLLAQGKEDFSHLVTFLQRFKRRTGYHFKRESGAQLWQDSYYDRVIRTDEDLELVAAYIFNNPMLDGLCGEPKDYSLSGGAYFDAWQPDRTEVPSLHRDSQARPLGTEA
jgi:REP element-mobilizing transposase RayT